MVRSLLIGAGLMLVLEGLLPLFLPARWKAMLSRILMRLDGQIRFSGLVLIAPGLFLLLPLLLVHDGSWPGAGAGVGASVVSCKIWF